MSLDMTGKFVLVTIIIAVATGLILQFQGDIDSSISQLLGGDNNENDAEIVEISSTNPDQRIASLIDSCYQRYLENSVEDYVCYIVRSNDGSFNFESSSISNVLSEDVRTTTEFSYSSYNTDSIIIRYSSSEGKIVVE